MDVGNTYPILIVGAGPTGLMMACELARYHVPFRIVEQKLERTATSNAAGIQIRTLEIFSDIGIVDRFLEQGVECEGMQFSFDGKDIFNLSIDVADSIYKFILMLPQSDTEALLEAHLESMGFHVERNKTLNTLVEYEDYIDVIIGAERLQCSWVIGCDGAHSTVREMAGISFPGDDLEDRFVVSDVHVTGILHHNLVNAYANVGTVLAIFPLGKDRYRLAANLHGGHKELSEYDVKTLVNTRAGKNVNVVSASWISPFWIHSKLAEKMRSGRIFLAGDAAHIHSPVGGQGMNTGVQDAYNLAWKLAYVLHGKADISLLDSYELERRPVIQEIEKNSERATKLMISKSRILASLRNLAFKFINSQLWLKKKIVMQLTQLAMRYANSPIIDYSERAPKSAPAVGERAPDVILSDGKHLHDYFNHTEYNALIFTGTKRKLLDMAALIEMAHKTKSLYANMGKVLIVSALGKISESDIDDTDRRIHSCYKLDAPIMYVVRPDGYIAAVRYF
jgi:2-polyprenyl-6-methoxyphenol hydroxylase-like FAD-dependent oxidoreductase